MPKDIESAEDVSLLIDSFYKKVLQDEVIGYLFTDIVELSWEKHIPIMNRFWNSILFGTAEYSGNPMIKHIELDKKEKLRPEHFDRWLSLWEATVSSLFRGEKADLAVSRARQIASLMKHKIEMDRKIRS